MATSAPRNRLIELLPDGERTQLEARLERVHMDARDTLLRPGEPLRSVYFPVTGVASIVATTSEGWSVEVATVGNEGMVGLPVFLEARTAPLEMFWQIPGEADRMAAPEFHRLLESGGMLPRVLQRYTHVLMVHMAQSVACNRLHSLEQRAARWLCHTHDRCENDDFALTQEFFAMMLGVHRPSVTIAAGVLQKAGFISYMRGKVRVLDRAALQEAACECYSIITDEHTRMLGDATTAAPWDQAAAS